MSKIGKQGTLLSIVFGFVFTVLGIVSVIVVMFSYYQLNVQSTICYLIGFPVIFYGIFLIVQRIDQYKKIDKGEEYELPEKEIY